MQLADISHLKREFLGVRISSRAPSLEGSIGVRVGLINLQSRLITVLGRVRFPYPLPYFPAPWYYPSMDELKLPEGELTFAEPQVFLIQISNNSEPLVSLKMDGTIEYGPNYTPDEAARVFWEALGILPRNTREIREKVELLDLDFKRLDFKRLESKYGKEGYTEWMDVRETIDELKALVK